MMEFTLNHVHRTTHERIRGLGGMLCVDVDVDVVDERVGRKRWSAVPRGLSLTVRRTAVDSSEDCAASGRFSTSSAASGSSTSFQRGRLVGQNGESA